MDLLLNTIFLNEAQVKKVSVHAGMQQQFATKVFSRRELKRTSNFKRLETTNSYIQIKNPSMV